MHKLLLAHLCPRTFPLTAVIDCSWFCQRSLFSYLQGQCTIWGNLVTGSRIFPAAQRWPGISVSPHGKAGCFSTDGRGKCVPSVLQWGDNVSVKLASCHQPVQESLSQKTILNVTLKWWLRLHVLRASWNINPWIRVQEINNNERGKLNLLRCLPVGSWVGGKMSEVVPSLNSHRNARVLRETMGYCLWGLSSPLPARVSSCSLRDVMTPIMFGKSKLSKPFR